MRFGANEQRTVTIGRVWAARYHGIMVSRYTDRSGQLDYPGIEERETRAGRLALVGSGLQHVEKPRSSRELPHFLLSNQKLCKIFDLVI